MLISAKEGDGATNDVPNGRSAGETGKDAIDMHLSDFYESAAEERTGCRRIEAVQSAVTWKWW